MKDKYALDENGKAYRLPDEPEDPVANVTEKILSEISAKGTDYAAGMKVLETHFPDLFRKPRPVKELKERMHHHYCHLGVPFGDPYLLARCLALATCEVLHYQGCSPFSVSFPDLETLTITAGYKTVLVSDEPAQ